MAWKTLTTTGNATVYVNVNQIAHIRPTLSGGATITLAAANRESSPVSLSVTQSPATILTGETVS